MTLYEFFGLIWPLKKAVTDWWEGGMVGSRGGVQGGGGEVYGIFLTFAPS